jgi:hypothetical protein
VTIRNYFRTHRIGWPEVSFFRDGSAIGIFGGGSPGGDFGSGWALRVVLRDKHATADGGPGRSPGGDNAGRAVTARGTVGGLHARPETLRAIKQAAKAYGMPTELTGVPNQRGPGGSFDRLLVRWPGLVFAALFAASGIALAGFFILFGWGDNHHNNYTPAAEAFCAVVVGLGCIFLAAARRETLRQINQADKTVAGLAGPGDSTTSPRDRSEGPSS